MKMGDISHSWPEVEEEFSSPSFLLSSLFTQCRQTRPSFHDLYPRELQMFTHVAVLFSVYLLRHMHMYT